MRSTSAMFDPAKKSSANMLGSADPRLLAGISASGVIGTGIANALYTPEQNQVYADTLRKIGRSDLIPTGQSINPDEFPVAHQAADWLDRNITTPIPLMERPLEGVSNYLRALGTDRTKIKRLEDSLGAALDFL